MKGLQAHVLDIFIRTCGDKLEVGSHQQGQVPLDFVHWGLWERPW